MEKKIPKIYLGIYGVFEDNGMVLMIKKARGPYKGKYDLPGGGLNFGESIDTCLKREILEETNAKVKESDFFDINEYTCKYNKEDGTLVDFHHVAIYYKVILEFSKLKVESDGEDSNGAIFIPLSEIGLHNTSPVAFSAIKKLFF
jgi:ADP-ribose pyrophosphatase YjhB (NUDIX family)